MKSGIGIGLLLAALLGISPYYIGVQIEKSAIRQLDQVRMPGYQYSLDVDRGFASTILTYSFGIDPKKYQTDYELTPEQLDQLGETLGALKFKVYVQHGPILTKNGIGFGIADARMTLNAEDYPELSEYLSKTGLDHLFAASARLKFNGQGNLDVSIPAQFYQDDSLAIKANFSGLEGTTRFADFGLETDTTIHSDGGKLEVAGVSLLEIGKAALTSKSDMEQNSFWLGNSATDLKIDDIEFGSPEQKSSAQNFAVAFEMKEGSSAETVNISYAVTSGKFENNTIQVEAAQVRFAIENLSKAAIENYLDLVMTSDINDEAQSRAMLTEFAVENLPEVLRHSLAISIADMSFTQEGRTFDARFRVAMDPENMTQPVDVWRVDLLLPALVAEAHLDADESLLNELMVLQAASSVDKSFANQTDFQLTPEMRQTMINQQASMSLGIAVQQGILVREGGRIKSDISLANRVIDLNGTSMPAPF